MLTEKFRISIIKFFLLLPLLLLGCNSSNNHVADGGDGDDGKEKTYDKDCPSGLTPCLDEDGVVKCVDTESEDCHCGTCGNKCLCVNGSCGCQDYGMSVCGFPEPCISGLNSSICADIFNDHQHCGACFNECESGEICVEGICTSRK